MKIPNEDLLTNLSTAIINAYRTQDPDIMLAVENSLNEMLAEQEKIMSPEWTMRELAKEMGIEKT